MLGNGPHVLGNGPHVLGKGPHVLGNGPHVLGNGPWASIYPQIGLCLILLCGRLGWVICLSLPYWVR